MRIALYVIVALGSVALGSCGNGVPSGEECLQAGPQVGYQMRANDAVLIVGYTAENPTLLDFLEIEPGSAFLALDVNHYPQSCYSSFGDQPNYHAVSWLDDAAYRDGGVTPSASYCTSLDDPNCHPQPGQPHGEVWVTLYGHQNNIVIIPLSP
jgi:hypothetical protein